MVTKNKKYSEKSFKKEKKFKLYLVNDNINTISYVVDCLMHIFEYTEEQAFQVTIITHLKGSCLLTKGDYNVLQHYQNELSLCKLNSKIL